MIRAHRRRHLWAFATIAVLLPAILVAALAARRAPPVVASAPAALGSPVLDTWVVLDSSEGQVLAVPIRIQLLAPTATPTRLGIEIEPARAIGRPDVLVYWTDTTPAPSDVLPSDAFLVGSIGGARPRRFELPKPALQARGSLVLYSAAHREVLGTIPVPPLPRPARQAPVGANPSP